MPSNPKTSWEVTRDFNFSPRPGVFREFKKGEVLNGLTRECIARGKDQQALKPANTEEKADG